jgi:hypothetical protein
MSKRFNDPFARQYRTPDRSADAAALEEFLQNGGKIQRLRDSVEAERILARRRKIAAGARAKSSGMPAGIPLISDDEAISVSEE